MRQTLFRIPWDHFTLGGMTIPTFGFGLVLLLWILFGAWQAFVAWKIGGKERLRKEWISAVVWVVVAFFIVRGPSWGPGFAPQGIPIFGYGMMLFLGFIAAASLATWRAEREGIRPELIWDLAVWSFIPGILGARIFFALQYPDKVFHGKSGLGLVVSFFNLSEGGIVLYGGLIAGTIAYFAYCSVKKVNPLLIGDIIIPSIFVGVGFGRIGCLLNGCCYGDRCTLPWGISFPQGSVPWLELVSRGFLPPDAHATPYLHPTQIYSSIDGFLIALITTLYFPYRRRHGDVVVVAGIMYPITRFLIEFLRGDELGQFNTSLTISQWVSGGILLVTVAFMAWLGTRPPLDRNDLPRREPTAAPAS